MGYTLIIGELKTHVEYDGLKSYIDNHVEAVTDEQAPAFGEPTDFSNSRWPSYTSWHSSMRFFGLHDMMFNKETGLIRHHPDCVPLVKEHKEIIDKAYKEFYEKYPNCKAGYSPKMNEEEGIYEDSEWPCENNYATRLEWLKYWVDWALENCKYPVFYNSKLCGRFKNINNNMEIKVNEPQPLPCPKCKKKEGYYYSDYMSIYYSSYHDEDGKHFGSEYVNGGKIYNLAKRAHCVNCHTILPFKLNRSFSEDMSNIQD